MSEIQVFIENPEVLEAASIKFTKVLFDIWYERQLENERKTMEDEEGEGNGESDRV